MMLIFAIWLPLSQQAVPVKMDISVCSCSPVLFQSNLLMSVGMNILFPKYEMTAESAVLVRQSKLQTASGTFTVITRTT